MLKCFVPQNSKYTFKQNLVNGRHGWLRLTPAYSVQLVTEILDSLNYHPKCVFEPFSGTGTTELVCANKGIQSFALEINPFLVWLAKAKLFIYHDNSIDNFIENSYFLVSNINNFIPSELPSIHNIDRWWDNKPLFFLSRLKTGIKLINSFEESQLLYIAFCKLIIELSNAAFNHVSTSFKLAIKNNFCEDNVKKLFIKICKEIAESARQQPLISSNIFLSDSKNIDSNFTHKFDTVITSPPYPNRISYIRELHPYMYWLDYLKTPKDASDLDWKTIGGTWGKATSLLSSWKCKNKLPHYIYNIAKKVESFNNKSSHLMANYILKYFDDMYEHLQSVFKTLIPQGKIFYIMGNSSFYGIVIPIEDIIKDILNVLGFINISYTIVRKRNCKKQLYEYLISAQKP